MSDKEMLKEAKELVDKIQNECDLIIETLEKRVAEYEKKDGHHYEEK